MKGFSYITYSKFFFFLKEFKFSLAIFLFALNSTLCVRSFFSCIFILLEFQPEFFYSLIINSLIAFLIILPLKKKIGLVINKQKDLIILEMLPCGGLVSLFKLHGNNLQEFQTILKDIPRAKELIMQDKIFIENKNNNWEERCTLLKEACNMEKFFQEPQNKILRKAWNKLVESWELRDLSGNTNTIYNLYGEKEVFEGATQFFLSRNFTKTFHQNNIPKAFRLQISPQTPDIVAISPETMILTTMNFFDVKGILSFTGKREFKVQENDYNLIYHGMMSHDKLTQYILATDSSNLVSTGALLYCPKLDSILKAQIKTSPLTRTEVPGWYNFITDSFKPFKDVILP